MCLQIQLLLSSKLTFRDLGVYLFISNHYFWDVIIPIYTQLTLFVPRLHSCWNPLLPLPPGSSSKVLPFPVKEAEVALPSTASVLAHIPSHGKIALWTIRLGSYWSPQPVGPLSVWRLPMPKRRKVQRRLLASGSKEHGSCSALKEAGGWVGRWCSYLKCFLVSIYLSL